NLVVETYSGGAHCCWTYWVVSLGKIPTTVLHFENQRAADFSQEHDGKPIIHTLEGRFDYLPTSHAGSFFPDIYLRLDGRRLVDVSPEFRSRYDNAIQKALADLNRRDPEHKAIQTNSAELDEDIRYDIMALVGSYLYS